MGEILNRINKPDIHDSCRPKCSTQYLCVLDDSSQALPVFNFNQSSHKYLIFPVNISVSIYTCQSWKYSQKKIILIIYINSAY